MIRNDTNRYVELLNRPDWDSDRIGEGDQVFLNPGEPGFRNHLVRSILALVRDFGIDAAFLDTLGYWFNDPRFPLLNGYRQLAAELHHQAPHLVLATEGWWDALMAIFPLCQRSGAASGSAVVATMEGTRPLLVEVQALAASEDGHAEQHAEEVAEICRWAAEHAPAAELDQP